MRILGLLTLMMLMLSAGSLAQATSPGTAALGQQTDSLPAWRMFHNQRPNLDLFRLDDPTGSTCYTMRTYTVAREDPDSDATRIVRYTTCPKKDWKLLFRKTDTSDKSADR